MPVERNTPQLVKKGKGKKRPGYAGWSPGAGSPGTTKSGGNKNTGSTGRERGADRNRNQRTTKSKTTTTGPTNIHRDDPNAPPPTTYIGGKKYNVTPDNRDERNRAELKQQLMRQPVGGNRIDRLGNTKKSLFKRGGGGLSGLLTSIAGLFMGIPGLGLLTGGLGKIGEGIGSLNETLGDFREKTTGFRTQAEYDAARQQRQLQGRLDNLYDRKAKGKSFSQKNIDMLESQYGLSPSTAQDVLTGRDLKGFTESRGLQTPQTFSDPFANTVGTTTKVNAPANDAVSSTVPQDLDEIGKGAGYVGYDKNELAAIAAGTKTPKLGDLTSFIGPLATVTARERQLKNYFDSPIQPKKEGIMDIDVGYPSNDLMADALTTPTEGAYGFNLIELDKLKKAGYDPKEVYEGGYGKDLIKSLEPSGYTDADFTNEYGYPMTAGLLDNIGVRPAIKTQDTGLGFSIPTGDVGLNASGRLGNLSATVDAIDALKGESVNPQINYSGNFGNTTAYGNFSDDVQNIGLNFNNDKGLSGGISYDAITGEPRFDIGFKRTFADGGIASMFTRRG